MQKKWPEILLILEKTLTPAQFSVWIKHLAPCGDGNCLVLFAKNSFLADFIRSNLYARIDEAVKAVLGLSCALRIEAAPAQDAPLLAGLSADDAANKLRSPGATPAAGKPRDIATAARQEAAAALEGSGIILPDQAARIDAGCAPPSFGGKPGSLADIASEGRRAAEVSFKLSPRPLPNIQHLALPIQAPERNSFNSGRSWRFSFEDFVVGPSNELAFVASQGICGNALSADVLFLSSSPGLGKTHLMQAVGKRLGEDCNRSRPRVEYLTAEEFASRFYLSIKSNDTENFKMRYRNLDMLLLEDVHFFQGKEKMQEELLATMNALTDKGGKVIFSSSFAPRDLVNMVDQLQSRLCAGFASSISFPDLETRRRILRNKAGKHRISLPGEVEEILATHIKSDVRQIESCLQNLILKATLLNSAITLQMAWDAVSSFAGEKPILDLDGIIRQVCQGFGISTEQLFSKSRKQEYVSARNTAYFLARKHTDLSLEAIGNHFNRRHSTVIKGITNLEREINRQTPLGRQISGTLGMIEKNGNILR